jgi:hypothetical protein
MKPNTITIDDVQYVRADSVDSSKKYDGPIKIVVADRGFVYIGKLTEDDKYITLNEAKNIRAWGTVCGLGQLVDGPTSSTKTDKVGTIKFPVRAVISIIDVDQKKWNV